MTTLDPEAHGQVVDLAVHDLPAGRSAEDSYVRLLAPGQPSGPDTYRVWTSETERLLLLVVADDKARHTLTVKAGTGPTSGYGDMIELVGGGTYLCGPYPSARVRQRDGCVLVTLTSPAGATATLTAFQTRYSFPTGPRADDPVRMLPPVGLKTKAVADKSFDVEWTMPPPPAGVTYKATAGTLTGTVTGTVAAFTGATPETDYTVSVVASAPKHLESVPATLLVRTTAKVVKNKPAAPGKPALKPGTVPTPTSVILEFAHDGKNTTHYYARRYKKPSGAWEEANTNVPKVPGSKQSFTDVGPLTAGAEYGYIMFAYNGQDVYSLASPESDAVKIPAPPAKPPTPDPPSIAKVALPESVQIRWNKYPEQGKITGLRWECDDQTGGWPSNGVVTKDSTTGTHTPKVPFKAGKVEFRLIALNGTVESDPSPKLVVTFPEQPSKPVIGASPKPANVTVSWTTGGADTTNFIVLRREESQTWDKAQTLGQEGPTARSHKDTSAVASKQYRYRIVAANSANIHMPGPESDKVTVLSTYGDEGYGDGAYGGEGS